MSILQNIYFFQFQTFVFILIVTAKRILERLGIQTTSSFVKILSFFCLFFGVYTAWFFLPRNYWSSLDHELMASIREKIISILVGNLNQVVFILLQLYQQRSLKKKWKTRIQKPFAHCLEIGLKKQKCLKTRFTCT